MARSIKIIVLYAALFFVGQPLVQAAPRLDLTIEMEGFPDVEVVTDKKITFDRACARFGKSLTNNEGLWGSGPFKKVRCRLADAKKPSKTPWLLKVTGDETQKRFEIFFVERRGQRFLQASYSIRTEVGPLALMNQDSGSLIAFYLSHALPFRSVLVGPLAQNSDLPVLKGSVGKLSQVPPPQTLEVFTLDRAAGFWRAKTAGKLEFRGENGKLLEWSLAELTQGVSEGQTLFVAQVEDNKELLARLDQLIRDGSDNFFNRFLNLGRSAYVGGRYGAPINARGVMAKAPLIGIFGEFRSGFFSGIRLNYDFIPQQRYADTFGVTDFSWSRFQLGYAFSKNFSGRIINSVDFTPRLGVANLKYDFVADPTTDAVSYDFKMSRAPTAGIEIGAEKATNFFRIRAWSFGSYSVGVLPIDKNHTTVSFRVGLDLYREFLSLGPFKLALLGFGAYESTRIKKKLNDDEAEENLPLVSELVLNSAFLGGGLTFTW